MQADTSAIDRRPRRQVVVIMPTARCNCRCVMCSYWRAPAGRDLSLEEVAGLVPDLVRLGVRQVAFSGGEPLLHPDLPGMAGLIQDAGIATTIVTNGILLGRRAADLAPVCRDYVVSLDGPRPVHDAIRGVEGAFEALCRGVEAVRSARPTATLTGRCTVQALNCRHLSDTVAAAREIGLDRISFLPVDTRSPAAFGRPAGCEGSGTQVALGRDDVAALRSEIVRLATDGANDFASSFIVESMEKLRTRVVQHLAADVGMAAHRPPRCNAPWVSAVIEPDGAVRPCFFQPPQGNIRDRGLAAVVKGDSMERFLHDLDVSHDPVCSGCVCTLYLPPSAAAREPGDVR